MVPSVLVPDIYLTVNTPSAHFLRVELIQVNTLCTVVIYATTSLVMVQLINTCSIWYRPN